MNPQVSSLALMTTMFFAFASTTRAEDSTGSNAESKPTVFTISPSKEPVPALRYYLLPLAPELKRGSAYPFYARLTKEKSDAAKEFYGKADEFLVRPFSEASGKETEDYVRRVERITNEVHLASSRERCDWEYPIWEVDTAYMMLPDVNEFRMFFKIVAVKARHEIATRQFEQAIDTLRTGFAMARHIDQGPFLVHDLIAASCAKTMLEQLQELVTSADSPNMYWALTTLPRPLIDVRPSIELERSMLELTVPEVSKLEGIRSEDEWAQLLKKLLRIENESRPEDSDVPPDSQRQLEQLVESQPVARRYLLEERIRSSDQLDAMLMSEVIVRWMLAPYVRDRDDFYKWYYVSPWQIKNLSRDKLTRKTHPDESPFASNFLHWTVKETATIPVLLEQRIAGLRIVEAIRMHMAQQGSLPKTLHEITVVPVPDDPMTGKSFEYQLDDGVVSLRSSIKHPKAVNYPLVRTVRCSPRFEEEGYHASAIIAADPRGG